MANLRADNLTGTGGRNALDGSLFFNGNYDGLAIPSIALGSGDWTIEFWFYSTKEGSVDCHIYDGRGTGSASSAYPIIKFDDEEKFSRRLKFHEKVCHYFISYNYIMFLQRGLFTWICS